MKSAAKRTVIILHFRTFSTGNWKRDKLGVGERKKAKNHLSAKTLCFVYLLSHAIIF